jgi:hypothetical protein
MGDPEKEDELPDEAGVPQNISKLSGCASVLFVAAIIVKKASVGVSQYRGDCFMINFL